MTKISFDVDFSKDPEKILEEIQERAKAEVAKRESKEKNSAFLSDLHNLVNKELGTSLKNTNDLIKALTPFTTAAFKNKLASTSPTGRRQTVSMNQETFDKIKEMLAEPNPNKAAISRETGVSVVQVRKVATGGYDQKYGSGASKAESPAPLPEPVVEEEKEEESPLPPPSLAEETPSITDAEPEEKTEEEEAPSLPPPPSFGDDEPALPPVSEAEDSAPSLPDLPPPPTFEAPAEDNLEDSSEEEEAPTLPPPPSFGDDEPSLPPIPEAGDTPAPMPDLPPPPAPEEPEEDSEDASEEEAPSLPPPPSFGEDAPDLPPPPPSADTSNDESDEEEDQAPAPASPAAPPRPPEGITRPPVGSKLGLKPVKPGKPTLSLKKGKSKTKGLKLTRPPLRKNPPSE